MISWFTPFDLHVVCVQIKRALLICPIVALAAIDFFTKQFIFGYIGHSTYEITSFFRLQSVWNRGISFGMFSNFSRVIEILVPCILVIVLKMILFNTMTFYSSVGLVLIAGGALGNLADRLVNGSVYDFLSLHAGSHSWPAFNLADSFISIGAALFIFASVSKSYRLDS